jgi:hypothetical protein
MNQLSVTVFWTIIAVLLTIAAVTPVNSVQDSKKAAKTKQNPAALSAAAVGSNKGKASKPSAASDAQQTGQTTALPSSSNNTHSTQNCTEGRDNVTGECKSKNSSGTWYNNIIGKNKGMLERTMYVLIGVTVLVVLYFVIKTIR